MSNSVYTDAIVQSNDAESSQWHCSCTIQASAGTCIDENHSSNSLTLSQVPLEMVGASYGQFFHDCLAEQDVVLLVHASLRHSPKPSGRHCHDLLIHISSLEHNAHASHVMFANQPFVWI